MEKFFKIVGIIVVAWIVLAFIGMLLNIVFKTLFWVAILVGIAYIVASITAKRQSSKR